MIVSEVELFEEWKQWAGKLKWESYVLYLAYRDPRTPWYARLLAALVVGYAFSPVDLIPDFIPVLGCLDDLILLSLGIAVVAEMIPAAVLRDCRAQAEAARREGKPVSWVAAAVIVAVWALTTVLAARFVLERAGH